MYQYLIVACIIASMFIEVGILIYMFNKKHTTAIRELEIQNLRTKMELDKLKEDISKFNE